MVPIKTDHVGARLLSDLGGAIVRTVIHNQATDRVSIHGQRRTADAGAHSRGLVERGHHQQDRGR